MKPLLTALAALTVAAAAPVARLSAQPSAPPASQRWSPFLGCWSTSSAGVIGPMVCIVPTDTIDQVEFLTVSGDSVASRARIDASGTAKSYVRDQCLGVERASWSGDGRRIFLHAEYDCGKLGNRRSDALIDQTRSDAFTYVEADVSTRLAPARVVNFIVQLDTTVFPAEVKRRLASYRTLSNDVAELEASTAVSTSAAIEASLELAPKVIDAWLADRGMRAGFAGEIKRQRDQLNGLATGPTPRRRPRPLARSLAPDEAYVQQVLGFRGCCSSWGSLFHPTAGGRILTPEMVGFGLPYLGYQGPYFGNGWPP